MALIKAVNYDPPSVVQKAATATLPMTALDTTNLRIVFTAPASGKVLVRLVTVEGGSTNVPSILLGVLSGTQVVARAWTSTVGYKAAGWHWIKHEAAITVSGLTPATSYTWDAAYGVPNGVGGAFLQYGGANGAGAAGPFIYEIWEA